MQIKNTEVALLHDTCIKIYKFPDEGLDNWPFLSSQAILGRNYPSEILYLFLVSTFDDSVIGKWTLADRKIELFPHLFQPLNSERFSCRMLSDFFFTLSIRLAHALLSYAFPRTYLSSVKRGTMKAFSSIGLRAFGIITKNEIAV